MPHAARLASAAATSRAWPARRAKWVLEVLLAIFKTVFPFRIG